MNISRILTVGSLLEVPTHTVNMTTLRSTHDIWQSYSMSPYEVSATCSCCTMCLTWGFFRSLLLAPWQSFFWKTKERDV